MKLKTLTYDFSICKVNDYSKIDLNQDYCFTAKTEAENSLVCLTEHVPDNTIERDDDWKALRIEGVLDFSLIEHNHLSLHSSAPNSLHKYNSLSRRLRHFFIISLFRRFRDPATPAAYYPGKCKIL